MKDFGEYMNFNITMKVDWTSVLQSLLSFDIDETLLVYVRDPRAVKAAINSFDLVDDRTFANIFWLQFLLSFRHTFKLYSLNYAEKYLWGLERSKQRFEQCVKLVHENLNVAFASLVVRRYTKKLLMDSANEVADRTVKVISEHVASDETIPEHHRDFMVEKLNSIKLILGFPEELLEDSKVEYPCRYLKLTGDENFVQLLVGSNQFYYGQDLKNLVKTEGSWFLMNESTKWTEFTTEDESTTPLYNLNSNTICKCCQTYS